VVVFNQAVCGSFNNFIQIRSSTETQDAVKACAKLGEFKSELVAQGYTDEEMIGILGGNFIRVYAEILG
jgi:microsomal dipeptidase-like Zn-dependent dipeptidase